MRRVLVTGGAGFIGSSLTNALMLSKNCHVTILDNLSRGSKENISSWLGSPNFEFVQADLLGCIDSNIQKSSLQRAVDSSDIIFHLAANPDVIIGAKNTLIDFQQNIQVTYNLLEAIRMSKVNLEQKNAAKRNTKKKQLIFASSSTVYGEADKRPTPEIYSPLYPISLYGATKLACEAMISGYCHMFDIQCVIARLANIIGPTNRHGVIYDFITKLLSHPEYLDILGNGKQNKSYLYIADCVSALMLISEKMQADYDMTNGIDKNGRTNTILAHEYSNGENKEAFRTRSQIEVFNVGSDDTITVMEIAQIVIKQLSLKNERVKKVFNNKFGRGRGWKGDVPDFWLDCSKLKSTGWRPKYSNSKDGVIQTCKEYVKPNPIKKIINSSSPATNTNV